MKIKIKKAEGFGKIDMWIRPLDFTGALSYSVNINALLTPFGPAGFSFKCLA